MIARNAKDAHGPGTNLDSGWNLETSTIMWEPTCKPRLRPLEPFRVPDDGNGAQVGLRDPSRLSNVVLTLSPAALHLLSMMDGARTCDDIQSAFLETFGQTLAEKTLHSMLDHLEQAHFLEGPTFESYYQSLTDPYRRGGVRKMPHAAQLGIAEDSGGFFDDMLKDARRQTPGGPVQGVIAPHLDYPRGRPCYAEAYGALRTRAAPDRVVILGTNHFGRARSVVATGCSFETPLGITRTDQDFLESVEKACGDLRRYELDHVHEHSIELQVAWLQHLFGSERFEMVAFLCPDPCGPTGTAPSENGGVDLRDFARTLGTLIRSDERDTLLVAGADLSHVGAAFGDDRPLDTGYLDAVRIRDEQALDRIAGNDPNAFLQGLTEHDNDTRICSAGCILVLRIALPEADATILRYHQAVDESSQTCVTCAAVAFT